MSEPAEPLDLSDLISFFEDGHEDLIVQLGDQYYNREDLHECQGCDFVTPSRGDLDEDHLCMECAEEAALEWKHLQETRSSYRRSVM